VAGEDALLSVSVSATGFVRSGRAVRAETRAKSSVKGSGGDITPAG
jgi:DNA gyrase subunit A